MSSFPMSSLPKDFQRNIENVEENTENIFSAHDSFNIFGLTS